MKRKVVSFFLSVVLLLSVLPALNAAAISEEKMLYIKSTSPQALIQRVAVEVGKTYYFSFGMTYSKSDFNIVCLNDGKRNKINADVVLLGEEDKGLSCIYTYSLTIPEKSENGSAMTDLVFIGVEFTGEVEGYFFSPSVYAADDPLKNELLPNPDFSIGLDEWSWGWEAWFGYWDASETGEWSDSTTILKTVPFDELLIFEDAERSMLHIRYESLDMTDDILVQKIEELAADTEYTISFDYNFASGALNDAIYFVIMGDDGNPSTIRKAIIRFYTSNDYITSVSDDGINITYTFKLDSTVINSYKEFYAGFYLDVSPRMVTEVCIADLKLYDAKKPKINLLEKKHFNDMYGWYSHWKAAAEGSKNFGYTADANLDYLAWHEPYDAELFATEQADVHYGDTNFDGLIDIRDLVALKKHTVSSGGYISSFDCNGDTALSSEDLTALRRHLIGLEELVWENTKSFLQRPQNLSGGAEKEASALKTQIELSDDTLLQNSTSRVYYVSQNGTFADDKRMLYINSTSPKEFIQRVRVEAGQSYCFSFGISDSISFSAVCYTDGIRSNYDAGITLVSKNDLGDSTVYTYSYTISESFSGTMLYFGVKATGQTNGYLFSTSVYNTADPETNELLSNHDFSIGLDDWSWGWDVWFGTTTSFGSDKGLNEWSNNKTTLKLMDYDEAVLGITSGTNRYFVTPEEFKNIKLASGDTVLFRRGETFRLGVSYSLTTGVSYGAYGKGEKPVISGSVRDFADNSLWSTDDGFIWKTTLEAALAGNIVFNGGEFVGIPQLTLDEVDNDGDFWFDSENKIFYLYLRQLNPGHRFDSIEISSVDTLFISWSGRKNIVIENLDFRYVAKHAINMIGCENVRITGCIFKWIGGAFADTKGGRYGNGIQFWNKAVNCEISNNYLYQIYDSALTFQGSSVGVYTDITYTNNLIEYSSMNFEFWADQAEGSDVTISNIVFEDNILRFAGYGFAGIQRNNKGNQAFILGWYKQYEEGQISNFCITNNTFDIANCRIFYAYYAIDMINVSGNTYYQDANCDYSVTVNKIEYANSLENFTAAIKAVDAEATVYWQVGY